MKQKMFLDAAEGIIKENNYLIDQKKKQNIIIKYFKVDDNNFEKMKKTKGDYYTINYDHLILSKYPNRISKELATILNKILKNYKKNGKTLIIGLGNSSILADAIGPQTTNKVIATNHYNDFVTIPKIALFVPEVIGKTGISSFKLIKMLVSSLKPDTIIVIDSLATTNKNNLNNSIEISDTGIIPGSALNTNKEISRQTFGIPVIAIGVPLLIDIDSILYATPNISNIVSTTSEVVAKAINTVFLS